MNYKKWLSKNTKELSGKIVAITGSTGGLGRNICQFLCELNAELVLLDRNEDKSAAQIAELTALYPNAKISFIKTDLLNFDSVKMAFEKLKSMQISYLILNAGIYNVKREKTSLGYDNIFQVNFLMQYYITKELLPTLRATNGKVIATSSIAHNYSKSDAADIQFLNRKKSSKVYGNSKRYLTYVLFKLFENESCASLTLAHPGITLTNMTNHYPKAINWLIKIGIKLIFPPAKKASLNIIKAMFVNASKTNSQWVGPAVFNIWGKPKLKNLKTATKDEAQSIFISAEAEYKKLLKIL